MKDSFRLTFIDVIYIRHNKLPNAECMIQLDLRYAYNYFEWLMKVYNMIISLRQAFQGLTPDGSFCLPGMLKLRKHQCSKDA